MVLVLTSRRVPLGERVLHRPIHLPGSGQVRVELGGSGRHTESASIHHTGQIVTLLHKFGSEPNYQVEGR